MRLPPPAELPLGFAHRGARAELPDNTYESFSRALELGARALESDAWVTADGVVVLDHDGVVREGWRRRRIATMVAADLPDHIVKFRDLYERCGTDFHLSLDVKDPAAVAGVVETAESVGALEQLWLCSADLTRLPSWRTTREKVRLVASVRRYRLVPGLLEKLAADGIDVINLREREWDGTLVEQVHDAGLMAFGWDAQTPLQLDRLLGLGVEGVYSDHVERMVQALARRRQTPG